MAKFRDHRDIKWPGAWLIEELQVQGVPDIPYNRTMFIQQLTDEAPSEPEFVESCHTLADVFAHYKPSKEVEFADADGVPQNETLEFKSMMDFGKEGIINQSELLKSFQNDKDMYTDFIKKLRSITLLQKLLNDEEAKAGYLESIQGFIDELNEIDPE